MGEGFGEKNTNYLDVLRLVGIFAVITIHTVTGVSDIMSEQMSEIQLGIYNAIKHLGEIGVPLFLMVSGAIMLDPDKTITIKKLFGKYIKRFVLALLIFGTVFAFGELVYKGADGNALELFLRALKRVAVGKSWAHLWFMYVIIGIYLLLPLLRAFTAKADEKVYTYCFVLLALMQSVLPTVLKLLEIKCAFKLPISGIYLTYFLAGYYLRRYPLFDEENRRLLYTAGIVFAVLLIVIPICEVSSPENRFSGIGYSSPAVLVMSFAVFEWARTMKNGSRLQEIAAAVRPYVFGMYLVHTVFINFMYKVLGITPLLLGGYVLIPVIIVFTFAFSFVVSFIMKKIPWFGRSVV